MIQQKFDQYQKYILKYAKKHWGMCEKNVVFREKTTSTHQVLKRYINNKHYIYNYILITDNQTNGVGRNSSAWKSDLGESVLFSYYEKNSCISPILPIEISLKISEYLNAKRKNPLSIKWPNDFYLQEKKIAGVLVDKTKCGVVVSVGLNYRFFKPQPYYACWVQDEENPCPIYEIYKNIINAIRNCLAKQNVLLTTKQIKEFNVLHTLHKKQIRFLDKKNTLQNGTVLGIAEDGSLTVESQECKTHRIYSQYDIAKIIEKH